MLRFFVIGLLAFSVNFESFAQSDQTETSSPDQAKKVRMSKHFTGKAEVAPDQASAEFVPSGTILNKNDPFLTFNIKHTRTGVLKNDLVYRNAMNVLESKKTIAAGTPMYANSYALSSSRHKFRQIAWCAVQSDEERPVCMLWKGKPKKVLWPKDKDAPTTVAQYIRGSKSASHYYLPQLDFMSTYEGLVPEIEEQPVDFGREFQVTVSFERFKKDKIRLNVALADGDKKTPYYGLHDKFKNLKLNSKGEIIYELFGQSFKFTKLDKKKARFEILNP